MNESAKMLTKRRRVGQKRQKNANKFFPEVCGHISSNSESNGEGSSLQFISWFALHVSVDVCGLFFHLIPA